MTVVHSTHVSGLIARRTQPKRVYREPLEIGRDSVGEKGGACNPMSGVEALHLHVGSKGELDVVLSAGDMGNRSKNSERGELEHFAIRSWSKLRYDCDVKL